MSPTWMLSGAVLLPNLGLFSRQHPPLSLPTLASLPPLPIQPSFSFLLFFGHACTPERLLLLRCFVTLLQSLQKTLRCILGIDQLLLSNSCARLVGLH